MMMKFLFNVALGAIVLSIIKLIANAKKIWEGIKEGFPKLVGTDIINNFQLVNDIPEWKGKNPFGDGKASKRIIKIISDI